MKIRKARIPDLKALHRLINESARKQKMLPRSINDIYENSRDFFIAEDNGGISGVCALHILWEDLAEIRSLAVKKGHQGKGIGTKLVRRCVSEAKAFGVRRVFVLTYNPALFRKMNFVDTDKTLLPQKIWGDCIHCPKFPECDEQALILDL